MSDIEDAKDLELRRRDAEGREHHRQTRPLRLGFLNFLSAEPRGLERALQEGFQLFSAAEQLGYDLGLTLARHFQPYISGPISFLSAASQHTSTIKLGTGVLPFHAEDPIRLAEELGTLDHISGGRVEFGLAPTVPPPGVRTPWREEQLDKQTVWDRIGAFLELVAGTPLPTTPADEGGGGFPVELPARVTPHSPTLRSRLWAGVGALPSVEQAARRELGLVVSGLSTEEVGLRVEPQQYDQIARYRELRAQIDPGKPVHVGVGRWVLPLTGTALDEQYRGFVADREHNLAPDGRPTVSGGRPRGRRTHAAIGTVDEVVATLRSDVALAASDLLIVYVSEKLSLEAQIQQLASVSELVAPALREAH